MSWNTLMEDTQWKILKDDLTIVEAKVCLCDDHEKACCVSFLQVKGAWLRDGNFACNIDKDLIPEWDEESSPRIEHWMEFKLRKKDNGVLVLPNGEDDGEWIEVGKLENVYVPMYTTWHGVIKQTSQKTQYNCVWFDGVDVCDGSDEDGLPGYNLQVGVVDEEITHDASGSNDPFNAFFDKTECPVLL